MINILTWNIKAGQNKDGSYPIKKTKNLNRIAEIVRDYGASIVCLQEVDAYTLRSDLIHQAKYIAHKLTLLTGRPWKYEYIVSRNMKPGYHGNAILSYYPMDVILKVPLTRINDRENRSFLLTSIYVGGLSIYVGTFHLGLKGDQSFQAKKIKNVLKDKYSNEIVVLAGDLNAEEGSKAYYIMRYQGPPMLDAGPMGVCTLNCYDNYNNPKIDFFFVRGLSTYSLKAQVLAVDISDHRPIQLKEILRTSNINHAYR